MKIEKYYKKYDVLQAAIDAGIAISNIYESRNYDVQKKQDASLLTDADKLSHDILFEILSEKYDYPIISEEGSVANFRSRKEWEFLWLLDPLDGTREFVNRNGEFTVNIALVKNKIPIEGIIYVPVSKTLYFGSNLGAFKIEKCPEDITKVTDEDIIQLPHTVHSNKYVIVGSRSHMDRETLSYIREMKNNHSNIELISVGSSLKLCMIAEGNADAYPRYAPTMEWDTAAGDAICRAVGLRLINYETKKALSYNKESLLNPWFLVCRNDV